MHYHVTVADITTLVSDAIVNAANEQLLPGGGVCGAIHRAAGPELAKACAEYGGCPTGSAVRTKAFNMRNADWVIHAVGPIYEDGNHDEPWNLMLAYLRSMYLADSVGCRSIAFPCISTGIYRYPFDDACRVAVGAVNGYKANHLTNVTFCCFSESHADIYRRELAR